MRSATGAIILCGGRSRRMGRSKADLPFGGVALLTRVVARLAEEVERVVLVAGMDQVLPEPPVGVGVIVVRDAVADRGPLTALATGLAALPTDSEVVYATSTDAPFLARGWIALLVGTLEGHDAAAPRIEGRRFPLAAVYRPRVAREAAEELLARGELRLTSLLDSLRTRDVGVDELRIVDPDLATLCNMNTPMDYERALRLLEHGRHAVEE